MLFMLLCILTVGVQCLLKKPDSKKLSKRNKTRPFEDQGSVEFLSRANDCSLFAFGSHSKKRPHNLILGRCFDYQVLDMLEFGVDPASMKTIETMHRFRKSTAQSGLKPSFVFVGDEFEHNTDLARAKNLLLGGIRIGTHAYLSNTAVCVSVCASRFLPRRAFGEVQPRWFESRDSVHIERQSGSAAALRHRPQEVGRSGAQAEAVRARSSP